MATIIIKQTPLYLKNGKVGFILEENQYEFCDGVWDHIKSYMGFDQKFRLNRMRRLAEEINTDIDAIQFRQCIYKPMKNLTNKILREVRKKYNFYNPFANLEQMILLKDNKTYGLCVYQTCESFAQQDHTKMDLCSINSMSQKYIEYVENDLYNMYMDCIC